MPYAFTEQGIYMLMTVLKGEITTIMQIECTEIYHSLIDSLNRIEV